MDESVGPEEVPTVTLVEALLPETVAVIRAVPAATAVTRPPGLLTLAVAGASESKVAFAVRLFVEPSL
jgi:hypothetical protein